MIIIIAILVISSGGVVNSEKEDTWDENCANDMSDEAFFGNIVAKR